jgi:hypothetical protein
VTPPATVVAVPPDAGVSQPGAPPASAATAAASPSGTATAAGAPPHVYGAAADAPTRIVVHAVKDTWVQIRNGDDVLVQRTLHPGDSVRVPVESGLSLRTGNGAGIQLEIDGKLFKPMSGAVRTIALEPDRLAANNGNPPRSVELNSAGPPRVAQ